MACTSQSSTYRSNTQAQYKEDHSQSHQEVIIEGITCIKWLFPPIPDSLSKSDKDEERRKAEVFIGSDNLDVPMLDIKTGRDGTEFCDIIVITEHLDEWEAAMVELYSRMGYTYTKRTFHTICFQISWLNGDDPVLLLNLNPNKSKFMVQPGNRDQAKPIEWMSHYDDFK